MGVGIGDVEEVEKPGKQVGRVGGALSTTRPIKEKRNETGRSIP